MKKFITEVLMRQRSSHNVVKKTDDELTRYIKQKRIISNRRKFEDAMEIDTAAKMELMNTREIRMNHYVDMQNLEQSVYDKGSINDNELDYEFLQDSANYRVLGQKRSRPFFLMPTYARREDWEHKAGFTRYLLRGALGVVCLTLGYKLGTWDSKCDLLEKSNVVEFETEEQIYDILYNQKKVAVFLYLYSPGTRGYELFNNVFDRESSKYSLAYKRDQDPQTEDDAEDDIVFMRVHCGRHLNFCINKQWAGRIQPSAEIYSLADNGEVAIIDFDNQHRSKEGIEGFFTKHGLIEDKFDPIELLERGGRKFMQII